MPVPLSLRQYGTTGPPLVLMHGLFGSASNWGSIARQLQDDYRLLVPDLRNHGQSPHDPDVSYAVMAVDVEAMLDEQGIEQAILVGHSMGGKVAMQVALTHPQRVLGLAVVDMAPVIYAHDFEHIFAGFHAVDLERIEKRSEADGAMAQHIPMPGVRAFLQQNLQRGDDGWEWRLNLDALQAGQRQITGFEPPSGARFDGPAGFIHGADSDYLLPLHHGRVRELFPRAQICTVKGAGHWVYAEKPEGFAKCLQGFLATLPAG